MGEAAAYNIEAIPKIAISAFAYTIRQRTTYTSDSYRRLLFNPHFCLQLNRKYHAEHRRKYAASQKVIYIV